MGEPKRVYNLIEKTCLTEEHLENLADPNKYFILSIYNGLMHCGNCGKRMKCLTDGLSTLRLHTDIDEQLFSLFDIDGKQSGDIAKAITKTYDVLDENLDKDDKFEIINIWWDYLDIPPEEFIGIADELYENCSEFDTDSIEVKSKDE